MSLSRYAVEVGGIADELRDLLTGPVRSAAFELVERHGWDKLLAMERDELDKALKFLSQTPSQRDSTLAKMDHPSAAALILRARYLGLSSRKAIELADSLSYMPGSSYRTAAARGAQAALGSLRPSMGNLLPGWPNAAAEDDHDWDPDLDLEDEVPAGQRP